MNSTTFDSTTVERCQVHDLPIVYDVVKLDGKRVRSCCERCAEVHLEPGLMLQARLFPATGTSDPVLSEEIRRLVDRRAVSGAEMNYVVGFMFDETRTLVVLIEKQRPGWQKGKLNGPGGAIEVGETAAEAMAREFREETGLETAPTEWDEFCHMTAYNGDRNFRCTVRYFRAFRPYLDLLRCRSVTEEPVSLLALHRIRWCGTEDNASIEGRKMMNNLPWLLPMAVGMERCALKRFVITEEA